MNYDDEVMDLDGGARNFCEKHHVAIILNQGYILLAHRFVRTSGATKRGPHQGHNGKYMEVEGPYNVLPDYCSCAS